ncbi:MAG: 6-bladed beta-propeller [Gammaproteobacteria bacterium]|nr:6-bladed beta-propeller [Gammaproteobacteria bacterium]
MSLQKTIQILGGLLPLLLLGCASTVEKSADKPLYWPSAPVEPRYQYVTTLRSEESVRAVTAEDRFKRAMTGEKEQPRVLGKPFDVAAGHGLVVVTDTVLRKGFIFNLPRQKMYQFGHLGKQGVLAKPMGVAVGPDSQIYIADVSARTVFVYDAYGMFRLAMGGMEEFDRPVDVAVSPDGQRIYVVDAGGIDSPRHRVVVFDANGVKQFAFGERGEGTGQFNLPTQLDVAPDGTVYVLDAGNFRVQAFTATGGFLRTWGKVGRGFGDLARPRGLAVGTDGNVYVSDAAFRNVQVFTPQGQLLLAIGSEEIADRPGQYAMPAGVALDELGHVYIVDQAFAKVDVLKQLSEAERAEVVEQRDLLK